MLFYCCCMIDNLVGGSINTGKSGTWRTHGSTNRHGMSALTLYWSNEKFALLLLICLMQNVFFLVALKPLKLHKIESCFIKLTSASCTCCFCFCPTKRQKKVEPLNLKGEGFYATYCSQYVLRTRNHPYHFLFTLIRTLTLGPAKLS